MLRPIDIAWTAGFLEGEGSFQQWNASARVVASQVQREPLERLQALYGGKIRTFEQQDGSRRMTYHRWELINLEARGLMFTLYGFMSPKRRLQIVKALAPWKARGRPFWAREACPRGHAYTPENTKINTSGGGRQCRTCAAKWARAWYERKRAAMNT